MKRLLSITASLLALLVVAGCGPRSPSTENSEPAEQAEQVDGHAIHRATFFDGSLMVEYKKERYGDDSVGFVFYAPGHYHVAFSISPGYSRGADYMPKDFDIDVQQNPRAQILNQYQFPGYLRVTIDRAEQSEHHDLQ